MLADDVRRHHQRPVDRIDVAQLSIVLDPDGAADDPLQTPKTEIFQVRIFKNDNGVIVKQRLAANDGEVGKHAAQRSQRVHPVNEQVPGDFAQLRKRDGFKLRLGGILDQNDLQISLDDRAVFQLPELLDAITYINIRAHWKNQTTKTN